MLTSFSIRNFRLFQHLEVKRLSRVNLIVGKNNAGKSSFLEAVELHASNASPPNIIVSVKSRQETWLGEEQIHFKGSFDIPLRYLFYPHESPGLNEEELEQKIIDVLQLIQPNVNGVAFVEVPFTNNRIPFIKLEGVKEPLPLKSMGDGIIRLFHIMVALIDAQNGILLVDEFENGLYWKVQPKVWDVVFQLADRLNVQVFATTHSRDCIRAFDEVWNKYPQSGAFFRLDARLEGVKITEYNAETLTDAIETDIAVV
jgi:AAA15 family ATPase/GTPase